MQRQHTARQVVPSVEMLTFNIDEVKRELYRCAYGCDPTPEELENISLEVQEARTFPPYFGRRLMLKVTEVLQSGVQKMEIESCPKCGVVRKWAESMVHCTHELCSISEATHEEMFGQDVLDILNTERDNEAT